MRKSAFTSPSSLHCDILCGIVKSWLLMKGRVACIYGRTTFALKFEFVDGGPGGVQYLISSVISSS